MSRDPIGSIDFQKALHPNLSQENWELVAKYAATGLLQALESANTDLRSAINEIWQDNHTGGYRLGENAATNFVDLFGLCILFDTRSVDPCWTTCFYCDFNAPYVHIGSKLCLICNEICLPQMGRGLPPTEWFAYTTAGCGKRIP